MLRSLLRDSTIYVIPSILSRGISLLLVPIYTRILDPEDYGTLDLLIIFGSLVNMTVALEVSQGVARYYAGERDVRRKVAYASSAFWFTIVCYTAFLLVANLRCAEIAAVVMGRSGFEAVFRVWMVYIGLNGLFCLIQNQFRWEIRSKHYAVVSLIVTFTTAILSVALAYGAGWGLMGILSGMIGGVLAGCGYGLRHLRTSFRFQFEWNRLKEMLHFSAPLVPSGIAVFVSQYIDRLMINHYLPLDNVGIYGVGFRIASIIGLVMVGVQSALPPLVYHHFREPDTPRQIAMILRVFVAFVLMVFLSLSLFAGEIMRLVTTPAYYGAENIIVFLVPAILLMNMYVFAPGIGIAKKTYLILFINVFGAGLNTALNALLIPEYGISGAAVATLTGYGCVFAVYMAFSQRLYFVPHEWKRLAIGVTVIGIIAYQVPRMAFPTDQHIAIKIGFVFVAALVTLAVGLIRVSELRQLKQLVFHKN